MKVQWGNAEYEVIDKPTPHIVLDALKVRPSFPGRWSTKTCKVPKACTMDVLHLAPYKGCTVGCKFCSLPAFRGYNLLKHQHGVSVVFENLAEHLAQSLAKAKIAHTFDFGADADPLMPLEDKYHITEQCMCILNAYGVPFTCTTKLRYSPAIAKQLAFHPKSWAQMSIVTLDQVTKTRLEDNIRILKEAKVRRFVVRFQPYILGMSPDIPEAIAYLASVGVKFLVFGFLRAPMGKGRKMLEEFTEGNKHHRGNNYDLVELYHEAYPGYWQIDQGVQRLLLAQLKESCIKHDVDFGLCDVYERNKEGKFVSLQPEYGTLDSCECCNSHLYVKDPKTQRFEMVPKCPGNCLLCNEENPPCGIPEFARSIVADLTKYNRLCGG